MDLVHMATYSIRWAILWSTESTKIKQNQVVELDGLGVVKVNIVKIIHFTPKMAAEIFFFFGQKNLHT